MASEKLRAKMIDELINAERLPRLLQDPYANYVLQKALTVSKRQQFERLVTAIKPHLLTLKNTSFGKRIQSKIVRKFPHLGLDLDADELSAGGGAQGGHGQHVGQHQVGHMGHGGQHHYSQQQQPHSAMLQSGVAVGSALRGYGAISPGASLQHSMLQQQQQQQLALQQLSHQQQMQQQSGGGVGGGSDRLGQLSGATAYGGAVGLQGLSNSTAGELGEHSQLQASSHSLHAAGPPGLAQPLGNGSASSSASHSLLNGMPQLLAYPPSTLHHSNSQQQQQQPIAHHRASHMAVNHGMLPNYARPLM